MLPPISSIMDFTIGRKTYSSCRGNDLNAEIAIELLAEQKIQTVRKMEQSVWISWRKQIPDIMI